MGRRNTAASNVKSISMRTYTTQQICDEVHGDLEGLSELAIWGVDQLENAQQGQISFVRNKSFAERWL